LKWNKIMICPTCGGDTFIEIDDGLKCENCGYVYYI
jgi:ribosomal protein S27AE